MSDPSERQARQAALLLAHPTLFQEVFESAPDAILVVDSQGKIVLANARATATFGYSREELIGSPLEILLPERFRQPHVLQRAEFMSQPRQRPMGTGLDLIGHRKDGTEFHADISLNQIEGKSDSLVMASVRDITDRKVAEEILRKSESRHRLLFERNLAGVFVSTLDPDTLEGRRIDCNDAYAHILGYHGREELLGERVALIYFTPAEWQVYARTLLEKGSFSNLEQRLKRRDGSEVWVVSNVGVSRGEHGQRWVEGTMVDITERKRSENRLRELAHRVILMQEAERQRVARELHEEIGQILASANMNMALVNLELPGQTGTIRERVDEAMSMMSNMIAQVRALAHNLRPPSLDTLGLNAALEEYCGTLMDKTRVRIDYTGVAPIAASDAVAITLYRLLQEVLANAVKHAHADFIQVALRKGTAGLSLTVEYNGEGFDPRLLDEQTLDRPFHTETVEGMNLGLASLRERIRLLGGSLEIQSRPGGATRCVALVPR